jgi:hypothetical protein
VMTGTETSVSIMTGAGGTHWAIYAFEPDDAILSTQGGTPSTQNQGNNPVARTASVNGLDPPVFVFGVMGTVDDAGVIDPRHASGMTEVAFNDTCGYGHYRLYTTTPGADQSYDMDDEGYNIIGVNHLQFNQTVPYTLACATGSFAMTGVAATLNAGKTIYPEVGAFIFSGVGTLYATVVTMPAEVGAFVLAGIDAALNAGKSLVIEAGTFVFTGVAALFNEGRGLVAATGSFIVSAATNPILNLVQRVARSTLRGHEILNSFRRRRPPSSYR